MDKKVKTKLLDEVRYANEVKYLSYRTEQAYVKMGDGDIWGMHFALVKEPKSLKKQLLVEKTWLFVIHAENIMIIQGIRQWQGERSAYPNKIFFARSRKTIPLVAGLTGGIHFGGRLCRLGNWGRAAPIC